MSFGILFRMGAIGDCMASQIPGLNIYDSTPQEYVTVQGIMSYDFPIDSEEAEQARKKPSQLLEAIPLLFLKNQSYKKIGLILHIFHTHLHPRKKMRQVLSSIVKNLKSHSFELSKKNKSILASELVVAASQQGVYHRIQRFKLKKIISFISYTSKNLQDKKIEDIRVIFSHLSRDCLLPFGRMLKSIPILSTWEEHIRASPFQYNVKREIAPAVK